MPDTPSIDINQVSREAEYTPPKTEFDTLPLVPFVNPGGTMPVNQQGMSLSASTSLDALDESLSKVGKNHNAPATGGNNDYLVSDVKTDGKYSHFLPGYNNETLYSSGQSGWDSIANAGVNLVGKTVAYVGQTAGFIGGAPAALVTGDISNMTDNFLVNLSDSLKETVGEKFPIYKSERYQNGNIWQKLSSTDWWLDDAIDRVALTASMFVPGLAAGKGIGLFGAATDAAGVLRPTGLLSKALTSVAENPESYGAIGRRFLPSLYEAATKGTVDGAIMPQLVNYAKNLSTAELYSWNVIGQSALNAREAQVGVRRALKEQRDAGGNVLTDDEIESKAAEQAVKGFWYTIPLTLSASLIELPQMFSSIKGAKSMLSKFYDGAGMEIEGGLQKALGGVTPSWGKTILKAGLTGIEHGQNESAQVAVGRYLEDQSTGKDKNAPIQGIFNDFIDNINDPNGQNNIALGTIQGILMTAGGRAKARYFGEDTAQKQAIQSTYDRIQSARLQRRYYNGEFTEKDNFGKVMLDADGNVRFDQSKLADAGLSVAGIQQNLNLKYQYLKDGNTLGLEKLNHDSLSGLAYNFFGDPHGMRHLEALLTIAARQEKVNADRQNDVDHNGNDITVDTQLNNNLAIVQDLKRVYDAIEQRHGGFTHLDIDKDNPEAVKAAPEFINKLKWAQYQAASDQVFLNGKINQIDSEAAMIAARESIATITGFNQIEVPANPFQQRYNELIKQRKALESHLDEAKDSYKSLIDKSEAKKAFTKSLEFDKKVQDGEFDNAEAVKPSTEAPKTIKLKTVTGDKDIEVGKEYFLGGLDSVKEDGVTMERFPRFTVLGENEDGTIKVKDKDGAIHNIKPETFQNYKLAKVEDTLKNKKATFYIDHANDVFEYNFGKGKSKKGRLTYDHTNDTLYFTYKNGRGETVSTEVTGDQFVARKGFTEPMIKNVGNASERQQASMAAFAAERDARLSEKRAGRLKIFGKLIDDTVNRLENVNRQIDAKRTQVSEIAKDIAKLEEKINNPDFTKRGNLKKSAKLALRSANALSNLKENLENEITALESEKDELDFNLSYYQDTMQYVDELPTNTQEVISDLKEQISNIENLMLSTGSEMNMLSRLIDNVQKALDSAVDLIRGALNKFFNRYKNVPSDVTGAEWVEFLKLNPNFLKLQPNYKEDLKTAEDFIEQIEELDVKPNERHLSELRTNLEDLQKQLAEFDREYKAKSKILEAFEARVAEFKAEQAEQEKLAKEYELKNEFFKDQETIKRESGTHATASNEEDLAEYKKAQKESAKKSIDRQFISTAESSEEYDLAPKPYTIRKRVFFNNADNLPNRDTFRAIAVTANQEEAMGLKGLIDTMLGDQATQWDATRRTNTDTGVVAVVYVSETPEGTFYINEKGEHIGKYGDTIDRNTIENQLMMSALATTESTDSKGEPRYRAEEKEQFEALLPSWKAKRQELLDWKYDPASNPMPSFTYNLSRGIPVLNTDGSTNSVVGSLVTDRDQLDTNGLIVIPTKGTTAHNGENIKMPEGRPLLRNGATLQYLNNRNLTAKEQDTIYKLFVALAKEFQTTFKFNTEIASYLQNILYWGKVDKEKNSGRNQVFVDRDPETKAYYLVLGNGEKRFVFNEASLKDAENATAIKVFLSGVYNNVNNRTLVAKFDSPFTEITDVKEVDGKPVFESRTWKNYQRYLLDSAYEDGTARPASEIPLTTNVISLNNNIKGDYNMKQRYAILQEMELPAPVKKQEVKKEEPTTPVATPAPAKTQNSTAHAETAKLIERVAKQNNDTIEAGINQFAIAMIAQAFEKGDISDNAKGEMFVNLFGIPISFDLTDTGGYKITSDSTYKQLEAYVKSLLSTPAPEVKKEVTNNITEKLQEIEKQPKPLNISVDKDGKLEQTSEEIISQIESILNKIGLPYEGIISNENGSTYKVVSKDGTEIEVLKLLKTGGALVTPTLSTAKLINHLIKTEPDALRKLVDNTNTKTEEVATPAEAEVPWSPDNIVSPDANNQYSRVSDLNVKRMTDSDWSTFKSWTKKNLPLVNTEVLEDMLRVQGSDRLAWGKMQGNLLSIFKEAKRGTEYHEAFEYVFNNLLNPKQQQALLDEFRTKQGSFFDNVSNKKMSFKDASDLQAKERIADMFGEYRLNKVDKTFGQKVLDFFRSIVDLVRGFILNKRVNSKIDELFSEIDRGKFAKMESYDTNEIHYARAGILSEKQTNEYVQDMTARIVKTLFGEGTEKLFSVIDNGLSDKNLFENLRNQYIQENRLPNKDGKLTPDGEAMWSQLKAYSTDFMRTINMNIQDDEVSINEEGKTKNEYTKDSFLTNIKHSAPSAIKLALSTITKQIATPFTRGKISLPKEELSGVKGFQLLNFSRTFATLLGRMSNVFGLDDMVKKFTDLAQEDSNYVRVFTRLKGDINALNLDYSNMSIDDVRLVSQFFGVFSKQKPQATIISNDKGDVFLQDAVLSRPSTHVKTEWINNMRGLSQDPKSFITYNSTLKQYEVKDDIKKLKIANKTQQLEFLSKLGIIFTNDDYAKIKDLNKFANAVGSIQAFIGSNKAIVSLDGNALGIGQHLEFLANLKTKVNNPDYESTYSNIEGKQVQQNSEHNAVSKFEAMFNSITSIDELKERMPWLNDTFSANSLILKRGGLYFKENGDRTATPINIGYVQGTRDQSAGVATLTSDLNLPSRFVQEINLNLNGIYHVLVPADASTEWTLKMNNQFEYHDLIANNANYWNRIYTTFEKYLLDEVNLANENRSKNRNSASRAKELRFFKDILSKNLVTKLDDVINGKIGFDQFIEDNRSKVNQDVKTFIDEKVRQRIDELTVLGELQPNILEGFMLPNFDSNFFNSKKLDNNKLDKNNLSTEDVNNIFTAQQVNYIVSNIEMHKVLFGDPYQFAIKKDKKTGKEVLDELKRIKGWLSPRRSTLNHPEIDKIFNAKANLAGKGKIALKEGDPGYNRYRPYFNAVTTVLRSGIEDIVGSQALNGNHSFAKVTEADAASWITISKYREIKQKTQGAWTSKAEAWYQWEMAHTRQELAKKKKYTYTDQSLREQDTELVKTRKPEHHLEVLKPVATGNKFGSQVIDQIYHKTSQMPMFYSLVEGKAMEDMYVKLLTEKNQNGETNDYLIMISGVKVGAEGLHNIYAEDGTINSEPFNNVTKVDIDSYGIQVETSHEGGFSQIIGSQLTKEATLDLLEGGAPVGMTQEEWNGLSEEEKNEHPIYKEVKHNQMLREEMVRDGYSRLLNRMGIEDTGLGYNLVDAGKLSKALADQLTRRDASDNLKASIRVDENTGGFTFPFEASNSYGIIRNVLWSMVNKEVVQPSVNGSPHVQVPATMWENASEGRSLAIKTDNGYKKISREEFNALSDEDKKNVALTSDTLKFYTKEEPWIEVMLPNWFADKIRKSKKFRGMSNEDIIKELNKTDDARKILEGIGFRIPTQGHNSIEVFKVKQFLDPAMGYTIVVPSEITTKSGSDFDIDKLNTYLKNVYVDKNGDVKTVPYFGVGEQARARFRDSLDVFHSQEELAEAFATVKPDGNALDNFSFEDAADDVEAKANKLYTESIQNEYFDSLKKLIQLDINFDRLISPIDDPALQDLAGDISNYTNDDESSIKARLLDQGYMTKLRHAFLTGKKWVGIAATNITGHSLMQRFQSIIDVSKANTEDAKWLGDGSIAFDHNQVIVGGKLYSTLSGIKDKSGKFISDILSQFANAFVDIAKDPYIMKVVTSDFTVNIALLMSRLGIKLEQTAFFLAQPIVRQYVNALESANTSNRYDQRIYTSITSQFATSKTATQFSTKTEDLIENIKDYTKNGRLTAQKNAEQLLILDQYLRLSKIADHQFALDQSTNYDTTRFRSGDVVFRKQLMTLKADDSIISSASELLNSSFVGEIAKHVYQARDMMGSILKFEQPTVRNLLDKILEPFASNQFLNQEKFNTIGTKLVQSFLDYIIQREGGYNQQLKSLLVDAKTNIAAKVSDAKVKFPNNALLENIDTLFSDKEQGTKNIKLKVNRKETYDQNLFTSYMRELRDNPATRSLYNDIVTVGILQGTAISPVAFTNIIPIEDYVSIVSPIIDKLESLEDLDNFVDQNLFQKNNWMNDDVVPEYVPAYFGVESYFPVMDDFGNMLKDYYSSAFPQKITLKYGKNSVLLLNSSYAAKQAKFPVIKVRRIIEAKDGTRIDLKTGGPVESGMIKAMRNKGDFSYKDYYGYEQVRDASGNPLSFMQLNDSATKKKGEAVYDEMFVYKQTNLLGNKQYAVEYREDGKPSVIDNGTVKVENVLQDEQLQDFYKGELNQKELLRKAAEEAEKSIKTVSNENVNSASFTNHSGGAIGADTEWDTIGRDFGMTNNKHYYHGQKTPNGNTLITNEQLEEGWQHVQEANKTLKRRPDAYKSLLSRNWMQVKNADAVFAISTLSNDKIVNGGTGWAVQMAIDSNKPVFVFDQNKNQWFKWQKANNLFGDSKEGSFVPTETPTLTNNFAGIGTREINASGKEAIRNVYKNTFEKSVNVTDEDVQKKIRECLG